MEIMLIGLILFSLVIASITDIKTREVPDWLSYAFIAAAAGIRLIESIMTISWQPLLEGLSGFVVFFVIGYILYRTAQWGGGDTKLLMGVGAAIGLSWTLELPTLVVFLINMMLTGAVIGILFLSVYGICNKKEVIDEFNRQRAEHKRVRDYLLIAISLLLISAIILYVSLKVPFIAALPIIAIFPAYYIILLVKSIEKTAFIKTVAPQELTEGDWLAEPVKVGNKTVIDTMYSGVTKQDIKKLIELHAQGKIKKVIMKTGIPFVPSFLVGYICTIVIGNWTALLL